MTAIRRHAFDLRSTYEVVVIQERAEVDEDVLRGAVEEPRVRPPLERGRLSAGQDHDVRNDAGVRCAAGHDVQRVRGGHGQVYAI